MLNLLLRVGGRPFAYDEVEILQTLALAGSRLFSGLGNCVVSGCQLTPNGNTYDVGSGVLWLDGELRDFPGRAGVTLPALFQIGTEVKSDSRVHTLTNQNLPCAREQNAELVDYNLANPPSRRPLLLTANGPLMWWHRMQEKTHTVGKVEWLASYTAADYTNGVGTGAAWGWALCDGRSGRADLLGRFPVGFDNTRPDYATLGKTDGFTEVKLTADQNGQHSHVMETAGAHTHGLRYNEDRDSGGSGRQPLNTGGKTMQTESAGSHTHTIYDSGTGAAHENRPPFTVLVARQWVGFD